MRFPGFAQPGAARGFEVRAAEGIGIPVPEGALVALRPTGERLRVALACVDDAGHARPEALGLDAARAAPVPPGHYRSADLDDLARRVGQTLATLPFVLVDSGAGEDGPLAFRATSAITLFACVPVDAEASVSGTVPGGAVIEVQSAGGHADTLPPPLGEIRDEFTVARGSALAYTLAAGEMVQILDVEGRQCSDFMALSARTLDAGRECAIDTTVTRSLAGGAYPMPGLFDKFFDQDIEPMLQVVQDTVGRHDTFGWACTARGYENRGYPGHLNCSDNISDAFDPYGIRARPAWPAINFFFNAWISPHDNLTRSDEGWSRPGDYVLMRALNDLVCVSTACPDDIDPINGWNPTDVHVRIYRSEVRARRAVAYRARPDSEAVLTTESPFHACTSALTRSFAVARDRWMPTHFDATGALEEYWACRQAATIQDMSTLRKLDVAGPDAERLLQLVLTRDVGRIGVNRGAYALVCDERGSVVDDGTAFRMGPGLFRWCCGSDDSATHFREVAEREGLAVWVRDVSSALCNVAVQGPKSRDILAPLVFSRDAQPAFANLKWFGFTVGRLGGPDGVPLMVTRSGYTGELGYEIFCSHADAETVWNTIVAAGEPQGLVPQGGHALEMLRVESGLMAGGAEFGDGIDPDEAGLSFAVDLRKERFIGREAIERNRAAPRRVLVGLRFSGEEVPQHGDGVYVGRRQVGIVTSAVRSPELDCPIAMARIAVEDSAEGTALEVGKLDGHMKRLACIVTPVPFVDPTRARARA